MNLMLNMKDINKILAKTHFKCKKKVKKPTFLRKHVSLFFASVVSPAIGAVMVRELYTIGAVVVVIVW